MVILSKNEETYQAYVQAYSVNSMTWSLFAGFTFAAITLLLTQHPHPSDIPVQITLFVFAFMLFLFMHNLNGSNITVANCIRTAPQLPQRWQSMRFKRTQDLLDWIGWILLGYSVAFMYLLWGFHYLALASFALGLPFLALCYIDYVKPYKKHREKHPWIIK